MRRPEPTDLARCGGRVVAALSLAAALFGASPALACRLADAEDCPERVAAAPFALRLRVLGYESTADRGILARLRVVDAHKGTVERGHVLAHWTSLNSRYADPAARAPGAEVTIVGDVDANGLLRWGVSCWTLFERATDDELVQLALGRPETAGHQRGVDAGGPAAYRPDLRRREPTGRVAWMRTDDGRSKVEVLEGEDADWVPVRGRWTGASAFWQPSTADLIVWETLPVASLLPVLTERRELGPVTLFPGVLVDEEGCPQLEPERLSGGKDPTPVLPLAPGACDGAVGRSFVPEPPPTRESRFYLLRDESRTGSEPYGVLRASPRDSAPPIATLPCCAALFEAGRGNARWAHIVARGPSLSVRGWIRRDAIANGPSGVISGIRGGSCVAPPRRIRVPEGRFIEDERGSVLGETVGTTELTLLGVRGGDAWVIFPGLLGAVVGRVETAGTSLD